jgi:iron complex outermembrane recepter protein
MRIIGFKSAFLPSLMASSMLISPMAYAQEAAVEDAANNSDEIIVTAQKRNESLQKVPLSIQAIGTEKLDQLQVNGIEDTTKFLPSVTIQNNGPGFAQVFFRSVASGENANHSTSQPTVGVYLDEQPVTTIQGPLDIHIYDMARVEALAGPQGTLYGASSMAGTLKLVSNKPDTEKFYGAFGLEGNSVSRGGIGGVAEGFLNIPVNDRIAARVVGWYRKDAGYIDNILGSRTYPTSGITQSNAALVKKNYNEAETYGARLALGIELDDNWTLRPTVMGQIQNSKGSFAQERQLGRQQTIQYNPESIEDKWIQAAMTIEGKIGNLDVTYAGGYLRRKDRIESDYSDYSYFYDAIAGYGAYFVDNAGNPVNPNQYIQGKDSYKKAFQEFRIASPADKRLSVIAGLFWQRQSHVIEQNYIINDIADSITVTGTDSNIWLTKQLRVDRDMAAFGEATFAVTDKLKLKGGIRAYKYKNSLKGFFGYSAGYSSRTGEAACFAPASVPGSPCTNVDKTTKETDFIHKLNATYEIDSNKLIYATWSSGFRPGGINRRGTLPPYRADQLDNYEFGWKTTFGPIRWNGAVYQLGWKDIQLSFLGANGLTEIRNAGNARIRGIETDINLRVEQLTLTAGGSYNNAEITKNFCRIANAQFDCTLPGASGEANSLLAPAGTRLPVTAKFKGNFVIRHDTELNNGMKAHIQTAVSYTGGRRSDLRTAEFAIKGPLKAYTTLDMSLGVEKDAWSATLFANNLLNKNGVVNTGVQCVETICGDAGGDTASGGVFYDTIIKPRVVGIKVSREF